jgi:hypothetical protein
LPQRHAGQFPPTRDWDALKRAYESYRGDDLATFAAQHGITRKTLGNYARDLHWRRFDAPPLPPPPPLLTVPPAGVCDSAQPLVPLVTAAAFDALLARLFNVISLKLHQLEIRMQENKPLSQADDERETRSIGGLVKQVEKVREFSRPVDDAAGRGSKAKAGSNAADDAAGARRELKARIQRLRERPVE